MKMLRSFALLLAVFLLTGCAAQGYRYVENGDNSYIHYDDLKPPTPPNPMVFVSRLAPEVCFSSVKEMREDIKRGKFSEEEWDEISRFQRNSDDNVIVPSIDSLRDITLPDKIQLEKISWGGKTYGLMFLIEAETFHGRLEPYSDERLDDDLKTYIFETTAGKYGIEKTETLPNANGDLSGTARYYTDLQGGKWKDIYYTFTEEGTTFYVLEMYKLRTKDILHSIQIWGSNQSGNFFVYLNSLEDNESVPKLTVEEISQFGFEK